MRQQFDNLEARRADLRRLRERDRAMAAALAASSYMEAVEAELVRRATGAEREDRSVGTSHHIRAVGSHR